MYKMFIFDSDKMEIFLIDGYIIVYLYSDVIVICLKVSVLIGLNIVFYLYNNFGFNWDKVFFGLV